MGLGVLAGQRAGATDIGDKGGFWATTVRVLEFPAEEIIFSELLGVYTLHPVSKKLDLFLKLVEKRVN